MIFKRIFNFFRFQEGFLLVLSILEMFKRNTTNKYYRSEEMFYNHVWSTFFKINICSLAFFFHQLYLEYRKISVIFRAKLFTVSQLSS